MIQYDIIIRPVVTEKTSIQKEDFNQVSFEVDRRANRVEIRRAIEKIFNVKVADVKTMQVKGKVKQRGRIVGKRKDWKKAIVKLMPGERIDFFEGVGNLGANHGNQARKTNISRTPLSNLFNV